MHTTNFLSMIFLLSVAALSGGCRTAKEPHTAAEFSIVPEPVRIDPGEGYFTVSAKTRIVAGPRTDQLGEMLKSWFSPSTGYELEVTPKKPRRDFISLAIDTTLQELGQEGYRLKAERRGVLIEAPAEAGIFYGMQTLRQMLPAEVYRDSLQPGVSWKVPCAEITDYPRFAWRGMHLDVCRHFMPVEFVMKYIDLLAMHKMNRFHWHLTEDQGWRIEILQYPKLSTISAWRDETVVGRSHGKPLKFDGKRHGGVYTQDEIRRVVQYAKERFVTIVPEIEMPGHSQAALAAYPQLSCTGGPFKVGTTWGVYRDVYCAGNEKTFEFLENVLTEVMDLFPGEYIHVGGDECPKDRWEKCPKCQSRIKSEGLRDERELQSYFIRRIEKFLTAHNRRLIGWDEILEGGLAPDATVMSWRGEAGGIAAARAGHDVVMAPNTYTYFDYYQADPVMEPLAIGNFLPIEKVYSYDPVPAELEPSRAGHILGVQAQVWTEYIPAPEQAEYMAYPRACALAEVAWSPLEKKDYSRFTTALSTHLRRLDGLHVNYRKPG